MQILRRGIFMPAFDRILQLARMEEMDCEFVEVTAHEGARPTHAVWQGRVYHRGGAVVQDAFRIGHRAGTAVLPPCLTPQQLTEHQSKNTRRGTAGAFILVARVQRQTNPLPPRLSFRRARSFCLSTIYHAAESKSNKRKTPPASPCVRCRGRCITLLWPAGRCRSWPARNRSRRRWWGQRPRPRSQARQRPH